MESQLLGGACKAVKPIAITTTATNHKSIVSKSVILLFILKYGKKADLFLIANDRKINADIKAIELHIIINILNVIKLKMLKDSVTNVNMLPKTTAAKRYDVRHLGKALSSLRIERNVRRINANDKKRIATNI